MKYSILFILIFFAVSTFAQNEAPIVAVSEELYANANSIVLNEKTDVEISNLESGTVKVMRIIKIMNAKGTDHGRFVAYCDGFHNLQKFKGEVFDIAGNSILKIKKADLSMSAYSNALADGSSQYTYTPHVPTYPYTIVYEWEMSYSNGVIYFPPLSPLEFYNQSCVFASSTLTVPKHMGCRFKEVNVTNALKIKYDNDNLILRGTIGNIKAIKHEPLMPPESDFLPNIYFAPNRFVLDKKAGDMSTWESYGKWSYGLHAGRDILPIDVKEKIHQIADTCTSDREKVRVLYKYLGENTRYVSIQLGIGGLQPMTVEKVSKLGLGDCKGLSFFMKAMLNEVGIKSNYTEISTNKKELLKDFSSPTQMNHVILQVPLPGDTLWLECTSPNAPFGYVFDWVAGHDALLITENGGQICKLPTYPDTLNVHAINCRVEIEPTGGANIITNESEALRHYEASVSFADETTNKKIEILRKIINLNDAQISNISTEKDKSPIPIFYTNYLVKTNIYGKKTGNRLFAPVNIHRSKRSKYDSPNREHKFKLEGEVNIDSITIVIPQGYVIESLPKNVEITASMGSFSAAYEVVGNEINIVQKQYFKDGIYPVADNDAFTNLYNQAIKHYSDKVILRKE